MKAYRPKHFKAGLQTERKYEIARGEQLVTRGHGSLDELERKLAELSKTR